MQAYKMYGKTKESKRDGVKDGVKKTINYWWEISNILVICSLLNNNTISKYNMHGKTPSIQKCRKMEKKNIYLKSRQNASIGIVHEALFYCILCCRRKKLEEKEAKKTCK